MKDVYLSESLHHLSTCIVAKSEEIAKSDITISKESRLHMHDSHVMSREIKLISWTYNLTNLQSQIHRTLKH